MTILSYLAVAFGFGGLLFAWLINRAPLAEYEPSPDYNLDSDTLDELNRIRLRAFERTEQAEADAARCCVLLGIDPEADTCCRDWANEIVTNRAHVVPTIGRINRWRETVNASYTAPPAAELGGD